MNRTMTTLAIGALTLLLFSIIGAGQQAPPVPPVPGAGGAPQGGGGGGGGGRGGGQQTPAPMPAILQNYKPVTAERLKKPEDGDWLSVRRTYDGWGYSPLDEIKRGNVDELQLKWVLLTGQNNGHEAPPMVNNGVMFVSTPGYQVMAVDAKTGRLLWRYTKTPSRARGCSIRQREASLSTGTKCSSPQETRFSLRSMRRPVGKSGPRRSPTPLNGYYLSLAPLVADGKVMIGASGGENGIRGFVAAYRSGRRQGNLANLHHSRSG